MTHESKNSGLVAASLGVVVLVAVIALVLGLVAGKTLARHGKTPTKLHDVAKFR